MTKWALRWYEYDANALADIKQQINARKVGSGIASYPSYEPTAPTVPARQAPVPSSHANVPVVASATPSATAPQGSEKDQLRSTFNFRNRLHNREFTPR